MSYPPIGGTLRDKTSGVARSQAVSQGWGSDRLAPQPVHLLHSAGKQTEVIRQPVKKTDPNGARTLASYLSRDMLPEVLMKYSFEGEYEEHRD